jgi:hypothetical protein
VLREELTAEFCELKEVLSAAETELETSPASASAAKTAEALVARLVLIELKSVLRGSGPPTFWTLPAPVVVNSVTLMVA